MSPFACAAAGVGFTFAMTAAGSSVVLLLRGSALRPAFQRIFSGFASGVMTAALVWSLLTPAMEMTAYSGIAGALPALGGLILGGLFLLALDLWPGIGQRRLSPAGRLLIAVTLHNIPQGMAVGLACSMAAQQSAGGMPLAGAAALAIGIGLQNIPEGAAVALPLRRSGFSRGRSFGLSALAGAVEPVSGLCAVLAAGAAQPVLPWLLGFAAGAMLYVIAGDLMPASSGGRHQGTFGCIAGFALMILLDAALR